ncbi:MAG: hypothetical protein EAZ97_06290 [Bacteroidetes bacterium]|nr:MAG: hypothetical protein EAZ97_06290 [Bacteroidota bacterium]
MKILKESDSHLILFDDQAEMIKTIWLPNCADITEEEIRFKINLTVDFVLQYKPKYYFADNSKQAFIYHPDIQNWVAATLAAVCAKVGLKKFALITPNDFITELSLEQTAEEAGKNLPFELKLFKNENDATAWLGLS